MIFDEFILALQKVELHFHIKGSLKPDFCLALAKRTGIDLPYDMVAALKAQAARSRAITDAKAICNGAEVRKYAQLIGYASQNIAAGDHVHTHNVAFRNIDMAYEYCNDQRHVQKVPHDRCDSFMGFRRENGAVGARNYIAVVTSVNCSATAARPSASICCRRGAAMRKR